jgi:hypothetical protein
MSDLIGHSFLFYNMAWFPFERYELTTPLTRAQIERKIAQADSSIDEYTVTELNNTVLVETSGRFRLGGYYQSFKPGATVRLEEVPNGTKLKIVLKPKMGAIAVLVLIVVVFLAGIWFTQRTNLDLGRYKDTLVACTGLLVLAYLLPVTALNGETTKLKLFIADLFEVEEEN